MTSRVAGRLIDQDTPARKVALARLITLRSGFVSRPRERLGIYLSLRNWGCMGTYFTSFRLCSRAGRLRVQLGRRVSCKCIAVECAPERGTDRSHFDRAWQEELFLFLPGG